MRCNRNQQPFNHRRQRFNSLTLGNTLGDIDEIFCDEHHVSLTNLTMHSAGGNTQAMAGVERKGGRPCEVRQRNVSALHSLSAALSALQYVTGLVEDIDHVISEYAIPGTRSHPAFSSTDDA